MHRQDREALALSAGGSSGGSAIAVATGQCDAYVEEHENAHIRLTILGPWEQIQGALYDSLQHTQAFWASSHHMA